MKESTACTPLSAPLLLVDEVSKIGLNSAQLATAKLILAVNGGAGIGTSIFGRSNDALLASEKVNLNFQSYIPNDQWMNEVKNWFAISLAKLQFAVVEYATGPSFPPSKDVAIKTPTSAEGMNICKSIMVSNPGGYQSFSVLGLAIIFAVGSVIIITNIILEPLVSYIHRNWATGHDYRRLQWVLDGKLQLQRMAYQYSGLGSWENLDGCVPVTTDEAAIFRLPDGIDRKRPGFSDKLDASAALVEINQETEEQNTLFFTEPNVKARMRL